VSLSGRYSSCYYRCGTNFGERRKGEVRRMDHSRTGMRNTGNNEGWVLGKPMSNSGKEKELLREGRDPPHQHPSESR
jgi:hypothetical protein